MRIYLEWLLEQMNPAAPVVGTPSPGMSPNGVQTMQHPGGLGNAAGEQPLGRQDVMYKLKLISQRLGEKAAKYNRLLRVLAAQNLLDDFMHLMDEMGSMTTAKSGQIDKRFAQHMGNTTGATNVV